MRLQRSVQACLAVTGYILLIIRAALTQSIPSAIVVVLVTILLAFGFRQAQRVLSLELRNEQLHMEKSRREWELSMFRGCNNGHCKVYYQLGEMQDSDITNRAIDTAVSCDHDSQPSSLHSSEMRSIMPTILCGEL